MPALKVVEFLLFSNKRFCVVHLEIELLLIAFDFFAINTKLPIITILASKIFTKAKKKLILDPTYNEQLNS